MLKFSINLSIKQNLLKGLNMNDKEYIKIYRIPPIFERKSKILVTFLEY